MSRVSRHLGLVLAFALFAAPMPAMAQDVEELFREAVELLQRGQKQEALSAFERVLAADPSNQQAFDLWLSTDREVMLQLLVEGGEFEKVAKRFLERSKIGAAELQRDESAIAAAAEEFFAASDSVVRRQALNKLRNNHGEYAVPALLAPLADESADDTRVHAMAALAQMGPTVVLPLIEALRSDSAFQRRNVAIVLGMNGDPRAGADLLHLAATDTDLIVQAAATEAAAKCGARGKTAADLFLLHGDDYHHRRTTILRDIDYSEVVWSWEGGELVAHDVPRAIYNNELAKRAYYRALASRPDSIDALAGIARESVDVHGKLEALAAAGQDVDALLASAGEGMIAVAAAGPDALDRALTWSVQSDDTQSGSRIARILGKVATQPTKGLREALMSGSAGLAGEAAAAIAHISVATNTGADAAVVKTLGDAAARDIVRIAYVVDGDLARASALVSALGAEGVLAQHIATGALGVATIGQVPGVDVVLVGDRLPDITADAVITALRENVSFGETPLFLISADEELAAAYGDRIDGSLADAEGLSALDEVFAANLTGDRARADELAAQAAAALAALSRGGRTDLGGALTGLAEAAGRRDGVAIPALAALAQAGGAGQAAAALAVLSDDGRSDEARIAAADALGAITSRAPLGVEVRDALAAMIAGDASLPVRTAAARALGRLGLGGAERANYVRGAKVEVRSE